MSSSSNRPALTQPNSTVTFETTLGLAVLVGEPLEGEVAVVPAGQVLDQLAERLGGQQGVPGLKVGVLESTRTHSAEDLGVAVGVLRFRECRAGRECFLRCVGLGHAQLVGPFVGSTCREGRTEGLLAVVRALLGIRETAVLTLELCDSLSQFL